MRVLVHDYVGHPFQIQLSRELARRGHQVRHVYSLSFGSPHGRLSSDDALHLEVVGLDVGTTVDKTRLIRRFLQERRHGQLLVESAREFGADVIVSANAPLHAQARLLTHARREGLAFVYWLQDLYGVAVARILGSRLPLIGRIIGSHFVRREVDLLNKSDAVVLITEDFRAHIGAVGSDHERCVVIHNWAPLDEVPLRPRNNEWARENDLLGKRCLVYTGTLGFKHDPGLLLAAASEFRRLDDVRVVVVSEGPAAEWLEQEARARGLENLSVLPFQPFERMPEVMGTASVLVAILSADAGAFSVPSKVLTYLCAGRPLLLSVPAENLAARTVEGIHAGVIVEPGNTGAFIEAAAELLEGNHDTGMARRGREFAERMFDIERIADRFELVVGRAVRHARARGSYSAADSPSASKGGGQRS